MNLEIGTEAAQFPEKEYISGIFLAVCSTYRVDLFASRLKESTLFIGYSAVFMEKGTVFSKRVTTKKRRGDPIFCTIIIE